MFKKFACCGQVPRLSSLHYGFLEVRRAATAKELTAQNFLKEMVNVLFNGLKEPAKVSGRNCSAS